MHSTKYIGLDVHQAAISVAVLDSGGKLTMESIMETRAATILEFIQGLRGSNLAHPSHHSPAGKSSARTTLHLRGPCRRDPQTGAGF
jgi:hypothetical protein